MTDPRSRFLLVGFTWRGPTKTDELTPLFDSAVDWVRIAPNLWLLWTTNSPEVWLPYIKKHLGSDDFVFIAELNLTSTPENYSGWNSQLVWEWIDKHK
jgi:hypothetical protein